MSYTNLMKQLFICIYHVNNITPAFNQCLKNNVLLLYMISLLYQQNLRGLFIICTHVSSILEYVYHAFNSST